MSDLGPIATCELPRGALLQRYRQSGAYTDCYAIEIRKRVSQAEYVEAFYTTWVFKLERVLLAWFAARPSTDADARALASGTADAFAAWSVEDQTADQLLLCDFRRRTRSWLMSAEIAGDGPPCTRLCFGSAVVRVLNPHSGRKPMGFAFRVLLGFHKVYSRVLLRAAAARLRHAIPT